MAQFPNIFNCDLHSGPVSASIRQMYLGDIAANRVGVRVTDNGEAVALSGTCSGTAMLYNGGTVALTGVVDGNVAYVDLPAAVYTVEGPLQIFVTLTHGGSTTTLLEMRSNVTRTDSGVVIDPGTIIPSVAALISDIEDAVASIPEDYSELSADVVQLKSDMAEVKPEVETLGEDVSSLKSAILQDITPQTGWTKGVINATNANITTGDNGVTSPKTYDGVEIVIIGSCKVAARVYKNNVYLGAIKINWVVNKQSGSWMFFTDKIDINEVFEKTDSDCIEFSVIPTDSTTITTETATEYALGHINIVGNKIDVLDAEVEAISDKVDELEQEIADIGGDENYIDQNLPFIWQSGYWGITDGTYHTGNGWQCSTGYLNDSIIAINAPATYNLYLMAYESDDTYVGAWNGSEFSKTYTAGSGPYSLNLEEFRHDYPGYKFKLTTIVSSGSLASEKDVLARIPASIAEMKASMSNHSTVLGTISTRLKMKDYYENFEVSSLGNSYTVYPNTGNPNMTRARIKQEFIQRIPENAALVYVSLNESIFGGTKYKVAFGFYDSNYKQVNNSGWITAPYAKTFAVSSEYKYYMLYIATNTASVVDLDDLSNDGCIVQFDVDQDNYIEKEKLANQNILGIIDKINDIDGEVDEVKQSEDTVVAITSNIRVVNHRGYSTAPENTIPAFELSVQKRYLYVETDVLFTAPDTNNPLGVPVLLHDASINRTARNADGSQLSSTVNIADITYAEALEYDFGIYKGAQWAGTKIPTFSEFMAFCKAYGLHPFIELKNEKTYSQDEIDLILTIIKQYGMRDHVTFISYSYDALALVQTRWDDVELGLNGTLANTLLLRTTKNRVFNLAATYAQSSFIESLIENDVPICRWTIDSTSALISLDKSYDTILTNSLTVKQVQEALEEEFNQS